MAGAGAAGGAEGGAGVGAIALACPPTRPVATVERRGGRRTAKSGGATESKRCHQGPSSLSLMSPVSRGFRGRPRPTADAGRLPPGQYETRDFPVLSAGPTPRVSLAAWDFTVRGLGTPMARWTWDQFQALPRETVTTDIGDVVVAARLVLRQTCSQTGGRNDVEACAGSHRWPLSIQASSFSIRIGRSRTRRPLAWNTAFAIAPAAPATSPAPLAPRELADGEDLIAAPGAPASPARGPRSCPRRAPRTVGYPW